MNDLGKKKTGARYVSIAKIENMLMMKHRTVSNEINRSKGRFFNGKTGSKSVVAARKTGAADRAFLKQIRKML